MLIANTTSHQLWWFVARSSGIVSWSLCTLSVIWGLLLSTRVIGKKPTGSWLLDFHRFVGGLSIVFVFVHITGIALDSFVHFGWSQLFVPLASKWHPVAVAWGIVSFYLLVAIEVTSLGSKYLPKRLWRYVHYSSFAVYILTTIHFLTAGTDAHTWAAGWAIRLSVFFVTLLICSRLLAPSRAAAGEKRKEALARIREKQSANRAPKPLPTEQTVPIGRYAVQQRDKS